MPEVSNTVSEVATALAATKPTPEQTLSALLALFGKPAKGKAQKVAVSKTKTEKDVELPSYLRWNEKKTGYRVWTATAKIVQIEEQVCSCCGTVTKAVKDELFELENITAHSVWLRHEGFGIDQQEDLPIRYVDLPPKPVAACAACRHYSGDELSNILDKICSPVQMNFPF